MFLGHYGAALAAKRAAPRTSLGTLAFAGQFLDELWPILLLLGVESVRVVPGLTVMSPLDFVHYPISHSLAAAVLWGLLLGGIYRSVRGYGVGALVVVALVVSHWVLDVPVHRPDLPLWPGSDVLVGAGLWNSLALTVLADAGVFVVGLAVYLRGTRAADRIGRWGLWAMVAVLVAFFAASLLAPPPPNADAVAFGALGIWLFVPWSYWIDRHRVVVDQATVAAAEGRAFEPSRSG